VTTPDVPPENDAREGAAVAPPAETKSPAPGVDDVIATSEPAPASNSPTDAGALAPSPASKAAQGDVVSKKSKSDPETLEQLIEYAYGRKGQSLALKPKSERPVAQNARLDDEALGRLFKIAKSDSLLAVPRQILLLAQELAGLPAVKSALRSFVSSVMSRRQIFSDAGVQEVLRNSPDGPTPVEALGHILAFSPVQGAEKESLKPGELRELKQNAARLFVTWVATDRNWPADDTAGLLFEALWHPAAKELADDTQRLRALTEAGGAAGVGMACQRFRQQAVEARTQNEQSQRQMVALRAQLALAESQLAEAAMKRDALQAELLVLQESSAAEMESLRNQHTNDRTHLRHEIEQLRGRLVRRLTDNVDMLEVGLSALRKEQPRVLVMIERAEHVIDALTSEVKNLNKE